MPTIVPLHTHTHTHAHLQVPKFPLPAAPTLAGVALHIEGEDFSFGKVILEELMMKNLRVVYRTSGTCLSVVRGVCGDVHVCGGVGVV